MPLGRDLSRDLFGQSERTLHQVVGPAKMIRRAGNGLGLEIDVHHLPHGHTSSEEVRLPPARRIPNPESRSREIPLRESFLLNTSCSTSKPQSDGASPDAKAAPHHLLKSGTIALWWHVRSIVYAANDVNVKQHYAPSKWFISFVFGLRISDFPLRRVD
jgi:hypothetical protein